MPASRIARRLAGVFLFASLASGAPAAAAEPPPLDAYGELPAIENVALSPEGQLAMLTTVQGKRMVLVIDQAMKPINAMEVGDVKVRDLDWAGEDILLVERSDTQDLGERYIAKNAEFYNTMIVPAHAGGDVEIVFANDRTMLNAVFGAYGLRHIGKKWIGFYEGAPMTMGQSGYFYDGAPPALYAVDLASNKARKIADAPMRGIGRDWLVDAQGNVAATLSFVTTRDTFEITNAKGTVIASGSEPDGGAALSVFGKDGTTAIYAVIDKDDQPTFYEVPLDGSAPAQEVFADKDIEGFYVDRYSGRAIGYYIEDEDAEPVMFDADKAEIVGKIHKGFDPLNGAVREWTPDLSYVLVRTRGNQDSGTWYLVDVKGGGAKIIGTERPRIPPGMVGDISTVTYKAQDGLDIESILTLPPGREAKNLPLVVLPHGGPQAHDSATFDWWAQAFASRGYAVLQPNFRGSTGYGDEFMHAGDGEWGKKMQTDLSDGIAYLTEKGIADPQRTCIMGASYGGYAALAGVTLQHGLYRCAVSVAGVSDLEQMVNREYREGGSRDLRDFREETIGPRSEMDSISPRNFAAQADAPILLIHGRDDTVVPYSQSQIMASALKGAGKPFEFVELEGEDHWLSRSATRKKMLEAAMAFVEKYNPAD